MCFMALDDPCFTVRLAGTESDLLAAQRLRYSVFIEELGGDGPLVDHANRLERDAFDPDFDHLVLIDERRDANALDHVVGVYRLLSGERAARRGRFYSEDEYNLARLKTSGRKLLELGRSCVHPEYRGGSAVFLLWQGLAEYITTHEVDLLFGVASFHGTDVMKLAQPLSLLHHFHLVPESLRVCAWPEHRVAMDLLGRDEVDKPAAMRAVPALIKGYLRLGGCVGEGAFVDHAFNTTDICLVMETARITERQRAFYTRAKDEVRVK